MLHDSSACDVLSEELAALTRDAHDIEAVLGLSDADLWALCERADALCVRARQAAEAAGGAAFQPFSEARDVRDMLRAMADARDLDLCHSDAEPALASSASAASPPPSAPATASPPPLEPAAAASPPDLLESTLSRLEYVRGLVEGRGMGGQKLAGILDIYRDTAEVLRYAIADPEGMYGRPEELARVLDEVLAEMMQLVDDLGTQQERQAQERWEQQARQRAQVRPGELWERWEDAQPSHTHAPSPSPATAPWELELAEAQKAAARHEPGCRARLKRAREAATLAATLAAAKPAAQQPAARVWSETAGSGIKPTDGSSGSGSSGSTSSPTWFASTWESSKPNARDAGDLGILAAGGTSSSSSTTSTASPTSLTTPLLPCGAWLPHVPDTTHYTAAHHKTHWTNGGLCLVLPSLNEYGRPWYGTHCGYYPGDSGSGAQLAFYQCWADGRLVGTSFQLNQSGQVLCHSQCSSNGAWNSTCPACDAYASRLSSRAADLQRLRMLFGPQLLGYEAGEARDAAFLAGGGGGGSSGACEELPDAEAPGKARAPIEAPVDAPARSGEAPGTTRSAGARLPCGTLTPDPTHYRDRVDTSRKTYWPDGRLCLVVPTRNECGLQGLHYGYYPNPQGDGGEAQLAFYQFWANGRLSGTMYHANDAGFVLRHVRWEGDATAGTDCGTCGRYASKLAAPTADMQNLRTLFGSDLLGWGDNHWARDAAYWHYVRGAGGLQ